MKKERKTFFWTSEGPTWWSLLTGSVSLLLLLVLLGLCGLGHKSSSYCSPPSDLRVEALSSSIGVSVQCNTTTSTSSSVSSYRGKNESY